MARQNQTEDPSCWLLTDQIYPLRGLSLIWLLLLQVGSVIRNAEVQALAPVLLSAIADPNTKAKAALDTLLNTIFVNTVDAASLALIVPVVHRGLRDRSGDAKKKAARIVGDMCVLINEPKVWPLHCPTAHLQTPWRAWGPCMHLCRGKVALFWRPYVCGLQLGR